MASNDHQNPSTSPPETLRQPRKPIPERSALTYGQFCDEFLSPNQPVVIVDGLKDWQALRKWDPDFFRREFKDRQISINGQSIGVSEFISKVENSGPGNVAPYFRNEQVRVVFPELLSDLLPTPLYILPNWLRGPFPPSAGREAEIYIGGAGGGFPFLHYDSNSTHAFLGQVYGDKEAILYSPEQSDLVYPKLDTANRHHSYITDVETPDFARFPKFANAVAYRGILKPGSLLFIPSRWWHTARMRSASITISYNVANASNWRNVTDEVCYKVRCRKTVPVPFIAAYLRVLGAAQAVVDALGGRPLR